MIKIDLASFLPIYEQIKKEIKRKITLEVLKPHEPLPSIRDLASELIINPNTVARAYRELEREGFIYTRKGKGCYVSDNSASLIKKERDRTLNQILDQVIEEATKFNLSEEKIKRLFEKRLRLVMDEKKKRGKDV
jgi:GntR family transcriptional regulator